MGLFRAIPSYCLVSSGPFASATAISCYSSAWSIGGRRVEDVVKKT